MGFLLLLILWPIVEIAVFVQVAHWIGVLDALGLLVLVSLAGVWIVKQQGVGTLARMRAELDAGRVPTSHMVDGVLLLIAGFLLIVPGFVTDVVGLLLLLPPVRRLVRARWARRFRRGGTVRVWRASYGPRGGGTSGLQDPGGRDRWDPPELEP